MFRAANRNLLIVSGLACCLSASPSAAQWIPGGLPVSVETNHEVNVRLAPDGSGGILLGWSELSGANVSTIRGQRLTAAGVPLWVPNGVTIWTNTTHIGNFAFVGDGLGGLIGSWSEPNFNDADNTLAQRLDAFGSQLWLPDAAVVSVGTDLQFPGDMIPDGSGGAIVGWLDLRNGAPDIYAQRIDASGTTLWTTGGVPVCTAAGFQRHSLLVSDGADGAIFVWQDERSGTKRDLYAQRLNANGVPQWAPDGVLVSSEVLTMPEQAVVADGAEGVMIFWQDFRNPPDWEILGQYLDRDGNRLWSADLRVAPVTSDQFGVRAVSDSSGGAIVMWLDDRGGSNVLYAQRILPDSTRAWADSGVVVCPACPTTPDGYAISSDALGGAVVVWNDLRNLDSDIFAQRLLAADGSAHWIAGGLPITTATQVQDRAAVHPDGTGGAFIAWEDYRNIATARDIYAIRVGADGEAPAPVDVPQRLGTSLEVGNPFPNPTRGVHGFNTLWTRLQSYPYESWM